MPPAIECPHKRSPHLSCAAVRDSLYLVTCYLLSSSLDAQYLNTFILASILYLYHIQTLEVWLSSVFLRYHLRPKQIFSFLNYFSPTSVLRSWSELNLTKHFLSRAQSPHRLRVLEIAVFINSVTMKGNMCHTVPIYVQNSLRSGF